jgi:S-adenosylmethionine:tRNA ribosyltransferase-isomerase
VRFHVPESLEQWLLHAGGCRCRRYIQREPGADDDERYQTVFAREVGAGGRADRRAALRRLRCSARLRAKGVQFGHVTLHVGRGTFQPVAWTTSTST